LEIPSDAEQLIYKLSAVLPSYQLPDASLAHSRHFMPVGTLAKGREQTTLVFDTWANIGDGEMLIHWPCELNCNETSLLGELTVSLGYLGRSESWVEAELISDQQTFTADYNAVPHQEGAHPGRQFEQTSLMAAIPAEQYAHWRLKITEKALANLPLPEGKKKPPTKLLKEREKAIAPYPPNLLSCVTKDTSWWKQHGWSQPPGSQRVLYWRKNDSLQVGVPQRPRSRPFKTVTTMLLSLTTPSGNRASLPACTRALPQAELFHRAIVGRVGQGRKVECPELTGKNVNGEPLHDRHRHAHTIPVDLDGDGRLDHLIIYAKMGLRHAAQHAIRTLRRTWTKGGVGELQLAVVGYGDLDILRQLPDKLNTNVASLLGPMGGARVWESVTPFVPPRFLKTRGRNSLLGQVNAELASRDLPDAETLEIAPHLTRKLRHFVRRRSRSGASPPVDMGYGLRLTLSEPVRGPLLLGYASHYGLGMFKAVNEHG
jgi:CRISPR-associated protein Csb2